LIESIYTPWIQYRDPLMCSSLYRGFFIANRRFWTAIGSSVPLATRPMRTDLT
jgi:hypothetical protein